MLVDATSYATADAGSIPAVSTFTKNFEPPSAPWPEGVSMRASVSSVVTGQRLQDADDLLITALLKA